MCGFPEVRVPRTCSLFRPIAFICFWLFSGWSTSGAVEITGTFTSDLYVSEQTDLTHVRPYERLLANARLWQGAHGQTFSLHTNLRWTTDLSNKRAGDPQTYIYSAYAKLGNVPHGTDFRLGRQFVYSGAGSALLDGFRAQYRMGRVARIDLFGGSSVNQVDPERVRSLSDFTVAGGRLSYRLKPTARIGLGWMLRRSDGHTAWHRLSLDAEYRRGTVRMFSRAAANIADMRVAQLLARLSIAPDPWYISAEFNWREPSVDALSIFSIIAFERYREARVTVQRRLGRGFALVSGVDLDIYDTENSWRGRLGVRSGPISVEGYAQTGHRGDRTGLQGYANLRLHSKWVGFANVNISRYRVQDEQIDRSDAYSSRAGLIWRPGSGWQAQGEVQYLRNAVEANDTRLLLRIIRRFDYKPSGEVK